MQLSDKLSKYRRTKLKKARFIWVLQAGSPFRFILTIGDFSIQKIYYIFCGSAALRGSTGGEPTCYIFSGFDLSWWQLFHVFTCLLPQRNLPRQCPPKWNWTFLKWEHLPRPSLAMGGLTLTGHPANSNWNGEALPSSTCGDRTRNALTQLNLELPRPNLLVFISLEANLQVHPKGITRGLGLPKEVSRPDLEARV